MIELSDPRVLAFLITIIVLLSLYAFLVPRNIDSFDPELGDLDKKEAKLLNIASIVGNELYATLPRGVTYKNKNYARIEALITSSGNPWRLKPEEFFFMQFVTALLGFLIGWPVTYALTYGVTIPWFIVVPACTILGYMIPKLKYRDQAKKRDLDFKRQLPEALDLIYISLSGGMTFAQALRESLPNMQDGVLKEEFSEMIRQIDTGKTVGEALDYFMTRAPNESIKTFVVAVKEATELNVPLAEVLQSRAEASRAEFFALIHMKTASLTSKMMAVLTPTLIPALLIIVLAPSLVSLLGSLGG